MTRLEIGDYDPHARTLLVRRGKNGKSRLLPVGGHAVVWLERYLSEARPLIAYLPTETGLFLSGYGTAFTPAYLGTWVAKQMKRVGITKPGASHLFRHSCATHMHENGADILHVQEMLGHARLDTTQIYTHVSIKALQEVHARCHPHGGMPEELPPSPPAAALTFPSRRRSDNLRRHGNGHRRNSSHRQGVVPKDGHKSRRSRSPG